MRFKYNDYLHKKDCEFLSENDRQAYSKMLDKYWEYCVKALELEHSDKKEDKIKSQRYNYIIYKYEKELDKFIVTNPECI